MTLLSPIMFVINVNQFFGRSSPLHKSNVKSETQLLTIFHIPFSPQSPADSWRQSNFDICYSFSDSNVSPFDHSSLITNGWHTKFKILHLVIAHISSFRWQQRSFDASVRRMNRKKGQKCLKVCLNYSSTVMKFLIVVLLFFVVYIFIRYLLDVISSSWDGLNVKEEELETFSYMSIFYCW